MSGTSTAGTTVVGGTGSWLDVTNGDMSMTAIVYAGVSALGKLATNKKHNNIRVECAHIAKHIQEQQKHQLELIRTGVHVLPDTDANKYFFVLKCACDTGVSKLMCLALDIMQKLIAFGYLDGSSIADTRLYPNPNPHLPTTEPITQMQLALATVIAEGISGANNSNHINQSNSTPTTDANGHTSSSTTTTAVSSDISLTSLTSLSPSVVLSGGGSDGKLISVMIDTLYQSSTYKDQQVQLLVLKCILTCLTSVSCGVHGWSLLQAISTCFQIYLANPPHTNNSGEEINRVTAKATLTQIFNLVFQRMEHFAAQLKQMQLVQHQQQQQSTEIKLDRIELTDVGRSNTTTPDSSILPSPSPDSSNQPSTASTAPGSTVSSPASADSLRPPIHPVHSNGPVPPPHPTGVPVGGRRGFCVECGAPANHYCLHTKDSVCGVQCKLINLKKKDPQNELSQQLMRKMIVQLELCQNDAYYLLRALCKLAIKVLPPQSTTDKSDANSIAVDSKILSLQLLLSILSNAGPTFRTTKHFIACIKGDLVNCILRNSAASSIETIFALSSSLFVSMICHFKPHLHAVIGPVLDSIYLPYIASPNSTFEHKYISLTVLHKLSLDPQTLLELFINYDCDTGSLGNTFQKIATTLEKVCRSRFVSENWLSSLEESRLRLLALEGLVDTIKSLLHWTKRAQANLIANKEASNAAALLALSGGSGGSGYESDEETNDTSHSSHHHSSSSRSTKSASSSTHHSRHSLHPLTTPPNSATSLPGDDLSTTSFSMQQFQQVRAQRQKLDTGILKFNMKPKKGLAYLESHGLLHADSPIEVAEFFLANAASLDKVQVGEFMGEEAEFNKAVLYAYTERLDFHNTTFDNAIRKFLDGFWLPGEAQKIDRMMEKFAEQYHKHNPGNFSSADTAYVLAYSVIMLNTDAHSPNVKYRMSKEDFFKNCRGIDDGKDINPTFLGEIYDRITTHEIIMKDDPYRRGGLTKSSGKELKRDHRINMFVAESEELVKKTQDYLENYQRKHENEMRAQEAGSQQSSTNSDSTTTTGQPNEPIKRRFSMELEESKLFQQATDSDLEAVRPMFEILWYPSLATFSVLLEENEGKASDEYSSTHTSAAGSTHINQFRSIELCLDGYRHAIRLSSALGIETSRLAFVTSLRKFTLLGSTKEMKLKNIEAIKMLLLISHTEGNHLKESWLDVLQCISELERLHLFASSRPIADVFQSSPIRTRESDSINSIHVNKIDASSIDRVFTSSAHLDSDAIVDFVKALRMVSETELSNISAPRVFSLQKIVEITYYNMGRIRVVWSKIWSVLSAFITKAGCHPNLNVSMYAIDSLRQLAMKFLEKDELAHYQFQKQFFKPFELIMLNNSSNETRELIVQCMYRMVASRVNNIKSGWKGVFVVIHTAASQTYQPLVVAGFELLTAIMDQHFQLLTSTTDTMDECVNCLVAFGCNNFTNISLKAIFYLTQCCDHLGAQQVIRREKLAARLAQAETNSGASIPTETDAAFNLHTPVRSRGPSTTNDLVVSVPGSPIVPPTGHSGGVIEDELDLGLLSPSSATNVTNSTMQMDLKIWFLALTGLSRMVLDPRLEVRSRALLALFKILAGHGAHFSASTWRAVFCGVLFPIFDDVRHASDPQKKQQRTGGTSGVGMNSDSSTPVASDPSINTGGSSSRDWSSSYHPSSWRNRANWNWPVGATTPRQINRPTPINGVTAATAQPHSHSREPSTSSTPPIPGLALVNQSLAAHIPSTTPTAAAVPPRSIPTLPPKPPTNPTPRLPTMPPPTVPNVSTRPTTVRIPLAPTTTPENSWLQTTCLSALSTLVDLFDHFYTSVSFMLPDLLSLIHSCIRQDSEDLARFGIRCLTMLLNKVGPKLSIGAWWIALESMAEIVQRTMPCELMSTKTRTILGLSVEGENDEQQQPQTNSTAGVSENISRAGSRAGSRRGSFSSNGTQTTSATIAAASTTTVDPSTDLTPVAINPEVAGATETSTSTMTMPTTTVSPLTIQVAPTSGSNPTGANYIPPSPSKPPASALPSLSPLPPPQPSGSNPSVPVLPFASHLVVGKFRVQLQLLDTIFQVADAFFPSKATEQSREQGLFTSVKSAKSRESELDFMSDEQTSSNTHLTTSAEMDVNLSTSDEFILGTLTCDQLFFLLDLLSSSFSFARAFNLDLLLRRQLYLCGFQTEQTIQGRLPQLFLQETRATRLYMHLLFRLIRESGQGETELEAAQAMNGERWLKFQANQQVSGNNVTGGSSMFDDVGGTPIQPSYHAYVLLAERRCITLSLRFLSDYVSKTISGQLFSLEFSEELLCSFIDNLNRLSLVCPHRFQHYLTIFYYPLIQLITFGKENTRQHLGQLFQTAVTKILPFQPITPYTMQPFQPTPIPIPTFTPTNSSASSTGGHSQEPAKPHTE